MLGFENVLEGSPVRATVRATDTAICLSLTTEEFLSLLSENVEIAQGIFRLLIETGGASFETSAAAPGERVGGRTCCTAGSRRISSGGSPTACSRSISFCSCRRVPLLARATSTQLVALARASRDR